MDDTSVGITERDSPLGLADWAACGTGDEDEQDQGAAGAPRTRLPPAKLELLEWSEWDQTKAYDERPLTCLHYSIVLVQKKLSKRRKVTCDDINVIVKNTAKRTGRQGSGSATRRMLAERALEIDAEEEATGYPPAWQLYAAERQHFERHHKAADKPDPKLPSIVIKNVLLGSNNNTSTQAALTPSTHRLIIPGFCDTVVEEYKEGFDLVQIHED
ncbi:hypothetical protein SNOG_16593 [Parastagonospora nodorum SN15]|uniref:Uncharacterized protein n=2 Tax=Phaeosphaeria nodorum (strain SN15 / ATCC MYA-4574 / FGSC 10173) TaxID=321614 RepID=Q0TV82_PHANO|nr:hypothetical protein SNOG_16593 [Parastagonospora nodorum SN15]EAT92621.1 hypothetical protein SNOG_16593 [Parastagonospora nodorum SN15]